MKPPTGQFTEGPALPKVAQSWPPPSLVPNSAEIMGNPKGEAAIRCPPP